MKLRRARDRPLPMKPSQKLAMASLERAPFSTILGLNILSAENGVAVVRMPFSEKLLNDGGPNVPIHGGAIARSRTSPHAPRCGASSKRSAA